MVKLLGWILIAVSLARGVSHLASALPASDAAQLLQLLFNAPRTAPGLIDALTDYATSRAFVMTVVLGFTGALLRGAAQWGQQVLATRAALGEKEHLRQQLVRHRLAASGAHADRAGEDTILASQGLDGLDDYYTDFLPALMSALVIPVGLGGWILFHDWISAVVLVLTIPLIPLFMILIGKFTEHRVDEAATGLHQLSQHLLELARGLPVLVGLRRTGIQRDALQQVAARYQRTTMNTLKAAFMSGLALELISTLSVAIIAVVIGVRLVNGSLDLYAGLTVLILAAEVYLPFRDIGSAFHASEDGVAALQRAKAQIDQPIPQPVSATLASTPQEATDGDTVNIRDLTVHYKALSRIHEPRPAQPAPLTPKQAAQARRHTPPQPSTVSHPAPTYEAEILTPVVQDLNLTLRPGHTTVLADASGTGKSTILKILAGLLTEAEAHAEGSITGLTNRPVAYLGQHPAFVEATVADELHLVLTATARQLDTTLEATTAEQLVTTALAAAGLAQYHARQVDHLSPGERRRLGFARVMSRLLTASVAGSNGLAWLVVLDEPTAHLDHSSATRIRHVLHELAHGTLPNGTTLPIMLVIASHDPAIHAAADQRLGQPITDTARVAEPSVTQPAHPTPRPDAPHPSSRVTWRDWLRFLPIRQPQFLAGIAWAVVAMLSAALLAALSGWLIVQASYEPPILYLLAVIVGVRFFGIGRAVFRYAERLAVHDAVLSWANRIRLTIWDALGTTATQWHRLTRSGGALSVLISDVDQLRDALPRVIVPIPAAIITWLTATGIVAYMAPGAWWPGLTAGLLAFLIVPALIRLVDSHTTVHLAQHRTGLVTSIARLLTAAPDLAGNGLVQQSTNRFIAQDLRTTAPLKRNALAAGLGQGLSSLLAGWAAVQTMWVAVTHGISAPNTALAVMLMLALAEPFGMFSTATQQARALRHQFAKLLPLLKAQDTDSTDWVGLTPGDTDGISHVALDRVTVSYDDHGTAVLEDFSLAATTGDFVVVTGPSGSGKSTLLAVLLGFLEPVTGSYRITTTPDTQAAAALQRVAWCPQEAYLFDSTLRSNLALARDPAQRPTDAQLHEVLTTVGLGEWLEQAPHGLDTRLGPSGHFISGGQRQRVAVARALLADAHVVLLDEPTAHLGADEAAQLIEDLRGALHNKIVIMVTHDQRFADVGTTITL